MTETLFLKSSELRPGDVVHCHGLRVLIDQEIKSYPGSYGTTYNTPGRVINLEEAKTDGTIYIDQDHYGLIPLGWLYPDVWGKGERGGWGKDWDAEPRWTIQGNDNAFWSVEREV